MFTSMIFKSYSLSCKSLGLVQLGKSHPRTCLRALHNTCSNYHATNRASRPMVQTTACRPGPTSSPVPQQAFHCHRQTQWQHFHGWKRLKQKFLISIKARKTLAAVLWLVRLPLQTNRRRSGGDESPGPGGGPWSPSSSEAALVLAETTAPSGPTAARVCKMQRPTPRHRGPALQSHGTGIAKPAADLHVAITAQNTTQHFWKENWKHTFAETHKDRLCQT